MEEKESTAQDSRLREELNTFAGVLFKLPTLGGIGDGFRSSFAITKKKYTFATVSAP
jgi:hypothetical protein